MDPGPNPSPYCRSVGKPFGSRLASALKTVITRIIMGQNKSTVYLADRSATNVRTPDDVVATDLHFSDNGEPGKATSSQDSGSVSDRSMVFDTPVPPPRLSPQKRTPPHRVISGHVSQGALFQSEKNRPMHTTSHKSPAPQPPTEAATTETMGGKAERLMNNEPAAAEGSCIKTPSPIGDKTSSPQPVTETWTTKRKDDVTKVSEQQAQRIHKLHSSKGSGDIELTDLDTAEEKMSGLIVSATNSSVWIATPRGLPINAVTARSLRTLMFGSCHKTFPLEWKMQTFALNANKPKLQYGIIQRKGGPCGVLACVQAYLLKDLLFHRKWKPDNNCKEIIFSSADCMRSLAVALTNILWKIGCEEKVVLALYTSKIEEELYRNFDITDQLSLLNFTDKVTLHQCIADNINLYVESDRQGCVTFLYSAILTRGIENIQSDIDDPNSILLGAHGYCSQEMVDLLLTGRAVSNTFDGIVTLGADDGESQQSESEDRTVLKGVTEISEIGFLTLYEHYNSCVVGENLKCPLFPIWVVCSESHYSTIFATDKAVASRTKAPQTFDLLYYDGLLRHDEQICLTVDLTKPRAPNRVGKEDLIPPLEHCIRTKWKEANITWSGIEPLL